MRSAQITNGPEVSDLFVVNGTGTTISQGRSVHWLVGASCDGKSVGNIDALNVRAFAGVAARDIAANTNAGKQGELARVRGRLQVYIFAHGTSVTIGAGAPMGVGTSASLGGFSSSGVKDNFSPLFACDTIGASICSAGGTAYAYVNML